MTKLNLLSYGIVFLIALFYGVPSIASVSPSIPIIDVQKREQNERANISGNWAMLWGQWTPLADIASGEATFDLVSLPNYVTNLISEEAFAANRFGTYAITLQNLNTTFQTPSIRMRNVRDAWQAWWIDSSGNIVSLGQSGNISKTYEAQKMRYKTHILQLPKNSESGTLVIYLSAQLYDRAGMYGNFEVQELASANKSLVSDLVIRVALIAIGLLVVFQNLLFFISRPKERVLLLLALYAFATLFRAAVATDYADHLLDTAYSFDIITRLKYITIVWPAIASLHFFSYCFPTKTSALMTKIGYAVLLVVVIITAVLPLHAFVNNVAYYQVVLLLFCLYTAWLVIKGLMVKKNRSTLMVISYMALLLGVLNDIIVSQSTTYNVYLIEYSLFLFLFVQTQYHSLRFVSALDTAEHLTNNLQAEVAEKTKQLSIRNKELEEKADNLRVQRDRVKELSETDHLTGLFNRQTLDEYLAAQCNHAIEHSTNLSLAILDLDDFKVINDSHGHLVGDACLKALSGYLRQSAYRAPDFIARFGGEEVVVVLPNTPLEEAVHISQRVCAGLRDVIPTVGEASIQLTASFGVAEVQANKAQSPQHLLKLADNALYRAKARGKNQVVQA